MMKGKLDQLVMDEETLLNSASKRQRKQVFMRLSNSTLFPEANICWLFRLLIQEDFHMSGNPFLYGNYGADW